MFTKAQVMGILSDADKELSRARRHMENAARLSDPKGNAELMHGLNDSQDQLSSAAAKLQRVAESIKAVAAAMSLLIPSDEKPLALEG